MMKGSALVMMLGLVAAGCAQQAATLEQAHRGGVAGVVVLGPICPVEIQGSPCSPRPIQAKVEARDDSGRVVSSAESGKDGRFQLRLEPGTYELGAVGHAGYPQVTKPVTVTVRSGRMTPVRLQVDTGIR